MNITIPYISHLRPCKMSVFLLLLLCLQPLCAQHKIEGFVLDAETEEPLPFVNISIVGTVQGTLSSRDGHFVVHLHEGDVVKFSSVGYNDVVLDAKNQNLTHLLRVEMLAKVVDLNEVSVKADFSFDKYLYKQVLKHKRENQDRVADVGDYQINKKTLMLLEVEDSASLGSYAQKALVSNVKWDKKFLPLYKSRSAHYVSVVGKRKSTKELSRETEGVFDMLNQQLEELLLQKLSADFDFYRNQINIFDHGFISPLSNMAFLHYNIYLSDSLRQGDDLYYKFDFYPKDKKACLFQGSLWIDGETFALASIATTLPKTAGINYVKSMSIDVSYEQQDAGGLFYKDQKVQTLLSLVKPVDEARASRDDAGSMLGNKNILVLEKTSYELPTMDSDEMVCMSPQHNTEIDSIEALMVSGINTMRQSPEVRIADVVVGTLLTGYYDAGIIDLGPVHDIYTTNFVEGNRVTVPLRTNADLNENYSVGTYVGMGTKSKELKYGLHADFLLPCERRSVLSISYDNDYVSASQDQFLTFVKDNAYAKGNGNLISAMTAQQRNPYMLAEQKVSVKWVHDLHDGMEMTISPYYNSTLTTGYLPLINNGVAYDGYDKYGAVLNMRFSFGQKAEDYFFQRFYYNNKKPVVNLSVDFGQVLAEDFSTNGYVHAHAAFKNRFALGRCNFRMLINAGYIAGDLPYTMLEKPSGTYSMGYAKYGYNLLHFASFAHNVYTNTYVSCNLGGLILNHIPILNKLHMREVGSVKCYYGGLTKGYSGMFDMPSDFQNEMTKPYLELGVGVGNLFKILRVEYVRLINNEQALGEFAMKHGVRMKFELEF